MIDLGEAEPIDWMIATFRSAITGENEGKGEARAEALRQAQLTMKQKYPDPFYWGAFICQGEPGPLPERVSGT